MAATAIESYQLPDAALLLDDDDAARMSFDEFVAMPSSLLASLDIPLEDASFSAQEDSSPRDSVSSTSTNSSSSKRKRGADGEEDQLISKEELRKLKNRRSAAKSREKSLERFRQLEERVMQLQSHNSYLNNLVVMLSQPAAPTQLPLMYGAAPTTAMPVGMALPAQGHPMVHSVDMPTHMMW